MVKKTLFLIITCCLFFGNHVSAQSVTLGYVNFPPYEFEDKGKPSGILVTIVEMLFEKADIPLELKLLPFKRAYEYVKAGNSEIDGLFNFYKTEERLNFFDYTEPVINNPLTFFVRKDSILKFNTLNDLKGLKVGVMRGYTYGTDFDKSKLFVKDPTDSHKLNFIKLVLGRTDAYPCDQLVGIHVAMKNELMSELKTLPTPLKVMDGYIGFTKGKHKETISRINKIIVQMYQAGEIEEVFNQFIEQSITKS